MIRRISPALAAAVVLCCALSPPHAVHAARDAAEQVTIYRPADRFTRGLLWKIERDSTPSFLFGTIHTDDPRVLRLAPPVWAAFDRADSFIMETFFNGAGLIHMAQAMFFKNGQTLKPLLGPELYAQTRKALAARGLPTRNLNKKKPWAVIMTLGAPRAQGTLFLDLMLQRKSILAGKPNYRLETMAEQIAVFDQMSLQDQARLLKETVRTHERIDAYMEAAIQAYLDRDLVRILDVLGEGKPDNSPAYDTMIDRLLAKRNTKMVERLEPHLRTGGAFIAVGAGHLPGEQGMLRLLEQNGYRLTVLY